MYWELQKVTNSLGGMTVAGKEPKAQKNPHFKAMQEARQRKKAERRLAAKGGEQKVVEKERRVEGTDAMDI